MKWQIQIAFLLAFAIGVHSESYAQTQRKVIVDRRNFDCFVKAAVRLRKPSGSVFLLDLRACPPAIVKPDRLGSFPSWERQGRTVQGATVDTVLLLTDRELGCLRNRRNIAKVRSLLDADRYQLDLNKCT